jgi:mannose-6-phosphate isomerase-like protein (cupin superfamily)
MPHFDLRAAAGLLPQAWSSDVLARIGAVNVKVLRMDGRAYPNEVHGYDEGLLVVEGRMHLVLGGQTQTVVGGELYVVPAGTEHAVAPGSDGTLLILDLTA